MKQATIKKLIFISASTLALVFTFSSFAYASEITGNLSSSGVNTTTTSTTGSIGGSVGGGSQVSGTIGNGTISGSVSGGTNSGGGGVGGGGGNVLLALAPTSTNNNTGAILGASTSKPIPAVSYSPVNSFSSDGMSLETDANGSVLGEENENEDLAMAGSLIPTAEASTFDQSASVIDSSGLSFNSWLWIILLLLILIAISMYIYNRSKEKKNYRVN